MTRTLLTAVFVASSLLATTALAQSGSSQTYKLKQDAPTTGTSIVRTLVTSSLPLDRPYAELSEEHKASLRSLYVDMPRDDQPPFPLKGLGVLYDNIRKGAGAFRATGQLSLLVLVGADGEASRVEILLAPDPDFGRFAASIAMLTKYKPGVCSGQPCAMEFPVRGEFGKR
jgi:hypothetical protein